MTKVFINEIFLAIQGESSYAGAPSIFLRTGKCNLTCKYCDTKYAYNQGKYLTTSQILKKINTLNASKAKKLKYICITGGEPLLQKNIYKLINLLIKKKYLVSIETNGSISIKNIHPKVKIILDIKTPDSGSKNSFLIENLNYCNANTELKFVICSQKDFTWAENFVKKYTLSNFLVLYSPSHLEISQKWLAKKILKNASRARLHLQLHKFLGDPKLKIKL